MSADEDALRDFVVGVIHEYLHAECQHPRGIPPIDTEDDYYIVSGLIAKALLKDGWKKPVKAKPVKQTNPAKIDTTNTKLVVRFIDKAYRSPKTGKWIPGHGKPQEG